MICPHCKTIHHVCPECKGVGRVMKYKKTYRVVECFAGHKWHEDKKGNLIQVKRGRPKVEIHP